MHATHACCCHMEVLTAFYGFLKCKLILLPSKGCLHPACMPLCWLTITGNLPIKYLQPTAILPPQSFGCLKRKAKINKQNLASKDNPHFCNTTCVVTVHMQENMSFLLCKQTMLCRLQIAVSMSSCEHSLHEHSLCDH
mmetsp:Transcript_49271/g.82675  ORF Transcript_49271/g.82675 Transcript_49271/m.82675 type:complete len:138 (-) Transcript_49271:117-530(-)